jgi:hypothetical protein
VKLMAFLFAGYDNTSGRFAFVTHRTEDRTLVILHVSKLVLLHSQCFPSLTNVDTEEDECEDFVDSKKIRKFFSSVFFQGNGSHNAAHFLKKITPLSKAQALQFMAVTYDTEKPVKEFKRSMVVVPSSWILRCLLAYQAKYRKCSISESPLNMEGIEFTGLDAVQQRHDGMQYFVDPTADVNKYMEYDTGKVTR